MGIMKNARHEMFCREYIKSNYNGSEAARQTGYSETSIRTQAATLLAREDIKARIEELNEEIRERSDLELDDLVEWLRQIAEADATVAFDHLSGSKVQLTDIKKLPMELRLCIHEISESKNGIRVKFYNRLDALEKLMRHLGGYAADNAQRTGEAVTDEEIEELLGPDPEDD